jgi:hypothetical protein
MGGHDRAVDRHDHHRANRRWRAGDLVGRLHAGADRQQHRPNFGPSLAIASNNSHAAAGGGGNLAIATNNSYAGASGLLNTAIADNNSEAQAGFGSSTGNTSIARDGSTARVESGNFNTVRATNNSSATSRIWSNNTVTATDGSTADISGDANRVAVRCGGSVVFEAQSNQIVTSVPCEAG